MSAVNDTDNIENKEQPSRKNVWQMFDRIAPTYDSLNHILSLGQDILWRRKLKRSLPNRDNLFLLDVATGTGDQIISLMGKNSPVKNAIGVDVSEGMLEVGRRKIRQRKLEKRVSLEKGDATALKYDSEKFDLTTISFGIRNVVDVPKALQEMHRVVKKEGRIIILEFALPKNPIVRFSYLTYFRHILPWIGSLVSGDGQAYKYLNRTVESFPYGEGFCQLLKDAGFENVRYRSLFLGVAMIYQGDRK